MNRRAVFDGGTASFFLAVLTGEADPFSERIEADAQHIYATSREFPEPPRST
ncbi:hypothetical protein ACWCXX_31820 [Streptomyces sp. NPDC001732]